MAKKKVTYDPNGSYECVKGTITHRGNGKTYSAGDGNVFDMSHRDAERINYLVEVVGVIAIVPATANKGAKAN